MNQKGLSLVRLLIVIAVACVIIGGAFLMLNNEKAKTRDAKRLSDISRLQAAFQLLYNETSSYQQASQGGCDQAGVLVSTCSLANYIPTIAQVKDPGRYSYRVTQAPSQEGFEITFNLEKSYGSLIAGRHTLNPSGIK